MKNFNDNLYDEEMLNVLSDEANANYYDESAFKSNSDPNGSYTGTPTDGSLYPVQDADDL